MRIGLVITSLRRCYHDVKVNAHLRGRHVAQTDGAIGDYAQAVPLFETLLDFERFRPAFEGNPLLFKLLCPCGIVARFKRRLFYKGIVVAVGATTICDLEILIRIARV